MKKLHLFLLFYLSISAVNLIDGINSKISMERTQMLLYDDELRESYIEERNALLENTRGELNPVQREILQKSFWKARLANALIAFCFLGLIFWRVKDNRNITLLALFFTAWYLGMVTNMVINNWVDNMLFLRVIAQT